jgi:hypothetical protein
MAVPRSIFELTDREAVRKAIEVFDKLKRDTFIEHYGFGRSREFFIKYKGRYYDSKPVAGLAFAFQHKGQKPLGSDEFGGGENTVQPVLERLDFEVQRLTRKEREQLVDAVEAKAAAAEEDEAPASAEAGRQQVWAFVKRRLGQTKFRDALIGAYGGRCAISGDGVTQVLEAAHIKPFSKDGLYAVSNGLLLRADLHLLFDQGLIAIADDYKVLVSPILDGTSYAKLRGKPLRVPKKATRRPSVEALQVHRANSTAG